MHKQIFPFGQPAEGALVDFLVRSNPDLSAMASQLTFGVPTVVSGTHVSVAVAAGTGYHGVTYTGGVSVEYNRLDLAGYFQSTTPTLNVANGTDPASIKATLLDTYQLYFTLPGDDTPGYSQASITIDNVAVPPTLTMVAAASNLIWQGTMVFTLAGETTLASILPMLDVSSVPMEPALTSGQSYAEAYYGTNYDTDGSVNSVQTGTVLSLLTAGAVPAPSGSVWDLGVELTGDAWVWSSTTSVPFNGYGAIVVYNGVAQGVWALAGSIASNFTNVCVITLSSHCTNLVGNLVIPYNVPGA
jgi:hypothetical protein